MKIMASGPITSWQIDGETMETVTDLLFLATKITADGDSSHAIKRHLFLYEMLLQRQNIIKQRRYFATKDLYIQSYGFSTSHVWM